MKPCCHSWGKLDGVLILIAGVCFRLELDMPLWAAGVYGGGPLYASADNEEDIITEVNSRNSKHMLLDIEDQACLAVCVYRSYSATLS